MPKKALSHILRKDILAIQPQNHSVELKEPANDNRPEALQSVIINGIPDNALILHADKMSPSLYRKNEKDICTCHNLSLYRRKCDYIIISEFENKNYIIYIEMKTSPRDLTFIPQLWSGRCFMEYLLFSMLHLESIKPSSDFLHRFVRFYKIPEDKDSTNLQEDDYKKPRKMDTLNDRPAKAYSCCVTEGIFIQLKDLVYEYNH